MIKASIAKRDEKPETCFRIENMTKWCDNQIRLIHCSALKLFHNSYLKIDECVIKNLIVMISICFSNSRTMAWMWKKQIIRLRQSLVGFWIFSGNEEYYMSVETLKAETIQSVLATPVVSVKHHSCLYFTFRLKMHNTIHLEGRSYNRIFASFDFANYPSAVWTQTAVNLPEGSYSIAFVATGIFLDIGLKNVMLEHAVCNYSGEYIVLSLFPKTCSDEIKTGGVPIAMQFESYFSSVVPLIP